MIFLKINKQQYNGIREILLKTKEITKDISWDCCKKRIDEVISLFGVCETAYDGDYFVKMPKERLKDLSLFANIVQVNGPKELKNKCEETINIVKKYLIN